MRTQRNVTGIAVWLAFLSWMYLVAGMMSPSEVVAQNQRPWYVEQRVAKAKIWQIPDIISAAIATDPGNVAEIVKRSLTVRTEASDLILGVALQAAPGAASQIMAAGVQVLSERQDSKPSPTKMVSHQADPTKLNNQTFNFNPFNPNAGIELTEDILEFTCQGLGPVAAFVNFCVVSPAL